MFVVTEAEAAAIRAAFDRGGEFSAAAELRRTFPGITDVAEARADHCRLEAAAQAATPDQAVSSQEPPLAVALYRVTGRATAALIQRQSLDGRRNGLQIGRPVGRGTAMQCILRLHARCSLRSLVQNPLRGAQRPPGKRATRKAYRHRPRDQAGPG